MISKLIFTLVLSLTFALGQAQKFFVPVSRSHDDAEWLNDTIDATDLEIDMGWDKGKESVAGFNFRNIALDKGTQLTGAFLDFTAQHDFPGGLELIITIESNPSPDEFWDSLGLENRSYYVTQINWTVDSAKQGESVRSPNVASLLNQLLSEPAWFTGKDASFIVTPKTVNDSIDLKLEVYSYNQLDSNKYPALEIYSQKSTNGISNPIATQVQLFPIPVHDILYAEFASDESITSIALYDLNGKMVVSKTSDPGNNTSLKIPASITRGPYLVEIMSNSGLTWKKVVIE